MNINEPLICPKCNGSYFELKKEATYLYSYELNTPLTSEWSKEDESLPFLFDNREQIRSTEYLQCKECKEKYSYTTDGSNIKGELTILKKAIRANYVETPEFLG